MLRFCFFGQTTMSWRSLLTLQYFTVLETTPRNQGSELFGAPMIPQMTVAADLTRREDWLHLKPGYAVGDCHTLTLPGVHEA